MKARLGLFLIIVFSISGSVYAANLLDIYQQALGSDPSFKAAQAQYFAAKENLPIARSAVLPNINVTGATQREHAQIQTDGLSVTNPTTGGGANVTPGATNVTNSNFFSLTGGFYNTSNVYSLNLTQPLFNLGAWAALRGASSQVKQAEADFAAADQDLMIRTAQAYFGVLQASDNLRYTEVQKAAIAKQLQQTQQQYNVGLIAITGVNDAKASYDQISATEIAARDNLANAIEALSAITGRTYSQLNGAGDDLPLVHPNPADIERWVSVAESQNYTLKSAEYGSDVAQENIKVKNAGHFPIINGTAGDKKTTSGVF